MKKFALTAAAAILAAIITAYAAPQRSADAALARNLTTFNAIVKELQDNYVDSIAPDRAFDAAIDALLATIDPYTCLLYTYPSPRDRQKYRMTSSA